jgi:arginine-tRNA-protein transferase
MGGMELDVCELSPPGPCGYLPGRLWRYEHAVVSSMTADEYFERLCQGWRRFGHYLFRPRCPSCTACQSLRINVARFRPSRSQRRNRQLNEGAVQLHVGDPTVTHDRLELYDRYHAHQTDAKGWPVHFPKDAGEYYASFVQNPFPTEEWRYELDGRLVGVGYVDRLSGGLSLIYFFYDPDERRRGLGVWNVLAAVDRARALGLPHVYLGFYVDGSASMAYKADYVPNQLLGPDGRWHDFRS